MEGPVVDKVYPSAAAAVEDIADGSTVGIAGFGVAHRFPSSLVTALHATAVTGLTVYCNGLGQPGYPTATCSPTAGRSRTSSPASRPAPGSIRRPSARSGRAR
jgi:3-oxoacid CoA-transferase